MVPLYEGLELVLRSMGDAGTALADRPFSISGLAFYDPDGLKTFKAAEQTFLSWLRAKQVTAIAPPNSAASSPILDPAFWDLGEVDWAASAIKGQFNWPGISGIRVDAGAIALLLAKSAKPRSSANRETDCRKWLEAEMRASLTIRLRKKQEYQAEAEQRFTGLCRNEFKRAWTDAISATGATAWRGAGRPRKSSR
jgi:hypothetical protein